MCPPSNVLSHVSTGPWLPCRQRCRVPHPGHGRECHGVPREKQEPHLPWRVRAITPQEQDVYREPGSACRQEGGEPRIAGARPNQHPFSSEKRNEQPLGRSCAEDPGNG